MKYRFYYCEEYNDALVAILKRFRVKYKIVKLGARILRAYAKFELSETHKDFGECQNCLKAIGVECRWSDANFSAEELENAKLLQVIPQKQCIGILDEENTWHYECVYGTQFGRRQRQHEKQIADIKIEKEPSMKTKTAIYAIDTGFSEIFADYRVKEITEKADLAGIQFRKVRLKSDIHSTRIFQLTTDNIIDQRLYLRKEKDKIRTCPVCGKDIITMSDVWNVHFDLSQFSDYEDFYRTECCFDMGRPISLYFVSQRFFRLLKENDLAVGVYFIPIIDG